ncbi:MAG: hypothetical protein GYA17_22525 [Chloroflexi bacterium]|jgi:hypothetical protein|nr:hypothetical protein [Anaerolineaceae bacterium]NMB91147.1 hypothetical protein [Chloroflexota bacterium]
MKTPNRSSVVLISILAVALLVGQGISFLLSPGAWLAFIQRVPDILSMIAFWGPIIAIIASLCVWATLRLLGFNSLEEIRSESVEQNNPAPAIIFVGTLLASILFLMLVIRP